MKLIKIIKNLVASALIVFCVLSPVHADALFDTYSKMVNDDAANAFINHALKNIEGGRCGKNICEKATDEEFENPPINTEAGRAAMTFGIISALSQWCGLDWKRAYLPMMAFAKYHEKMSDRNLTLMSIIHSDFMALQLIYYRKSGSCTQKFKNDLNEKLPKIPKKNSQK